MLGFPARAARAGVVQLDPQPAEPEAVDRDSTDYVEARTRCIARGNRRSVAHQVPLDIVLAYHRRLAQCATSLPPHQALQWLQQRDEEERQQWVDRRAAILALR